MWLDPTFGGAFAPRAWSSCCIFRVGPLGRFVEHITYYAGAMPEHSREKLIPDGAIQIIVDLTETPKRLYAGETAPGGVDFRKAWISGMHASSSSSRRRSSPRCWWCGSSRAARRRCSVSRRDALTNAVFPLGDVLDGASASLRDRVLEARGAAARVRGGGSAG